MQNYNIDGVEIPFDPNWKNIAISLSGGADSALLAVLLCKLAYNPDINVHIINHIRCWKTKPWQQHDADNVYNWLTKRFYFNFIRHTNFIAPDLEYGNIGPSITDEYGKSVSGDNIEIRSFSEYICHYHNVDAYYNAVTRNPRGIELGGMKERNIEPTTENQRLRLMRHMNVWAIHPFRFVDKSWVIKQYYNYELESLLDLTRSCEGEFVNFDYKNYTPGQIVPTCGECFWCKEREWAIEQNK